MVKLTAFQAGGGAHPPPAEHLNLLLTFTTNLDPALPHCFLENPSPL